MRKFFQSRQQELSNGLVSIIQRDLFSSPISIRIISFSLFLFVLGWGLGADSFYSLYLKEHLGSVFLISLVGALMPLSKMIFSLSIGKLEDHMSIRYCILVSKIIYVGAGLLYASAGFFHMPWLLIFATILNGFAGAGLFTSYESYIRLVSDKESSTKSFSLYFSSWNAAYVLGSALCALFIDHIQLPWVYLFISVFSIVSLFTDRRIPLLKKDHFVHLFGKKSFLRQFFMEAFSLDYIKKSLRSVTHYSPELRKELVFEGLFNMLNYIGFIFIPLVAAQQQLELWQIALIFGLMKIPYLTNVFTAGILNTWNKKTIIMLCLSFMSVLFAVLGFADNFVSILALSFGIAMGLATIRPLISAGISEEMDSKYAPEVTGFQHFVGMLGNVVGILTFGGISSLLGMNRTFLIVGVGVLIFAVWNLFGVGKKENGGDTIPSV